jgi:cell wall-associated NlpC family hydrolase
MAQPASARELALMLAERELGKPYIWSGDDPLAGWDCSGLYVYILQSTMRLPPTGDWSAQGLAAQFDAKLLPLAVLRPGMLVFFNRGTPPHIGHVEMIYAIYPEGVLTIGAGGGGSGTMTREDAIKQNAFVRIRKFDQATYAAAADPFNAFQEPTP